jgi:hypothetical protein
VYSLLHAYVTYILILNNNMQPLAHGVNIFVLDVIR